MEEKLREILDIYGDFEEPIDLASAIAQIIQLFENEKEKELQDFNKNFPNQVLLTGREWYERFEKELIKMINLDESKVLKAAKKASGVE